MTLRSTLARLPSDRATLSVLRSVLEVFRSRPGEPMTRAHIAELAGLEPDTIAPVLQALCDTFVLDFDSEPPRYSLRPERFLRSEIDGFMRRLEGDGGNLRSNVDKFRKRYGER